MFLRVRNPRGTSVLPLNIVLHGNSMFGSGSVGSKLATLLPSAIVTESSIGNATLTGLGGSYSLNGNFSTDVHANFVASGRTNRVYVWEGIDEINDHSGTAASCYASHQTYVNTAKANGWQVFVCTIVATTEFPELQSIRDGCDTLLRADAAGGTGVGDFYADVRMQDASDLTYFDAGGIHITSAGGDVCAGILAAIP